MIELVNTAPVTVPLGQSIRFRWLPQRADARKDTGPGAHRSRLQSLVDIWSHFPAMSQYRLEKQ